MKVSKTIALSIEEIEIIQSFARLRNLNFSKMISVMVNFYERKNIIDKKSC